MIGVGSHFGRGGGGSNAADGLMTVIGGNMAGLVVCKLCAV